MGNISIIQGDITKARVDAIVNAANPKMLGGGGVDGAIHKAAGSKLLAACRRVKATNGIRCPFGEARITEAGNLNARYVIHTVGPRYKIDESPEELLKSAYIKSLALAIDNDCKSVAFPAISCGAYGYPISDAAIVAFDICGSKEYSKLSVYFYLFGAEITDVWKQILSKSNT